MKLVALKKLISRHPLNWSILEKKEIMINGINQNRVKTFWKIIVMKRLADRQKFHLGSKCQIRFQDNFFS